MCDILFPKKVVKNFSGKFKRNSKCSTRDKYMALNISRYSSKTILEFQLVCCSEPGVKLFKERCYFFKIRFVHIRHPASSTIELAERAGFEPAVTCATPLFESGTINHSDTSPHVV